MKTLSRLALAIVILYWLHLLRNVSYIYFVGLGFFIAALLFTRLQLAVFSQKANLHLAAIFALWVYASVIAITQHLQFSESPLIGLFRLWSGFPLIYASAILANYPTDKRMRLFVGFYIIAALTLPLQYATGPIGWFAESSERAGTDRFATLTGSLTSFGISLGAAGIAALCFLPRALSIGAFAVLTLGGFLSLQKAAIANIFLALLFSIWIKHQNPTSILIHLTRPGAIIAFSAIVGISLTTSNEFAIGLLDIVIRITTGLLSSDGSVTGDVGFLQSAFDRITELPLLAISHHEMPAHLLGAGIFGAAGALGYPQIPMAHNGIVEIILMYGIPLGLAINVYLITFIIRLFRKAQRTKNMELRFLAACSILFYANNIFSGGGFFQPVSAFVFWTVFFRAHALTTSTSSLRPPHYFKIATKP